MIGALNGLSKVALVFLTEPRAAVTADVIEGADFSELIADHKHAFTCNPGQKIIASGWNVAVVAGAEPLF
jgi:hypothetical protein